MAFGWGSPEYEDRAARYRRILMEEADETGDQSVEPDPDDWYDRFREDRDNG